MCIVRVARVQNRFAGYSNGRALASAEPVTFALEMEYGYDLSGDGFNNRSEKRFSKLRNDSNTTAGGWRAMSRKCIDRYGLEIEVMTGSSSGVSPRISLSDSTEK